MADPAHSPLLYGPYLIFASLDGNWYRVKYDTASLDNKYQEPIRVPFKAGWTIEAVKTANWRYWTLVFKSTATQQTCSLLAGCNQPGRFSQRLASSAGDSSNSSLRKLPPGSTSASARRTARCMSIVKPACPDAIVCPQNPDRQTRAPESSTSDDKNNQQGQENAKRTGLPIPRRRGGDGVPLLLEPGSGKGGEMSGIAARTAKRSGNAHKKKRKKCRAKSDAVRDAPAWPVDVYSDGAHPLGLLRAQYRRCETRVRVAVLRLSLPRPHMRRTALADVDLDQRNADGARESGKSLVARACLGGSTSVTLPMVMRQFAGCAVLVSARVRGASGLSQSTDVANKPKKSGIDGAAGQEKSGICLSGAKERRERSLEAKKNRGIGKPVAKRLRLQLQSGIVTPVLEFKQGRIGVCIGVSASREGNDGTAPTLHFFSYACTSRWMEKVNFCESNVSLIISLCH